MKLLLAMFNVDFAKKMKNGFEAIDGVEVCEIISSEEDLIPSLARSPDITGVLLTTDLATKLGSKRLEVLLDILTAARENFPEVTFTVLANEKIGHPLLAEIVEIGILNIFVKGEEQFTIPSLIDVFQKPLTFDTAVKYRKVDENIPWRRTLSKPSTLKVEIKNQQEVSQEPKERSSRRDSSKLKEKKQATKDLESIDESIFEEMIDLGGLEKSIVPKATIIGTVLIAVAGVSKNCGSTYTAISIASYLKSNGYSVALVESNHSQDYDRIHSLYEGEKKLLLDYDTFEMNGLTHFKYRDDQNLNDIFSGYEYVVMDFGNIFQAASVEEFTRAHVKYVLCSADEWKFHAIEEFENEYHVDNTYCYLVPGASEEKVEDLSVRLKGGNVVSLPVQDDPYEPVQEVGNLLYSILGEFIKIPLKSSRKPLLIGTGIGVALAILFLTIYKILG